MVLLLQKLKSKKFVIFFLIKKTIRYCNTFYSFSLFLKFITVPQEYYVHCNIIENKIAEKKVSFQPTLRLIHYTLNWFLNEFRKRFFSAVLHSFESFCLDGEFYNKSNWVIRHAKQKETNWLCLALARKYGVCFRGKRTRIRLMMKTISEGQRFVILLISL